MTQVVNRPKRATTKVSISNSLISITPSYVLSCQSRGIVTGSSVFLGEDQPPTVFWQTLTGMPPRAHSSRKNAILQQKKPPGSA